MVEKTVPGAAFYNLSLIGMEYPWQAYVVNMESNNCVNQNGKFEPGMAMFITPRANIATYTMLRPAENFFNCITTKLQTPRISRNIHTETPQIHI